MYSSTPRLGNHKHMPLGFVRQRQLKDFLIYCQWFDSCRLAVAMLFTCHVMDFQAQTRTKRELFFQVDIVDSIVSVTVMRVHLLSDFSGVYDSTMPFQPIPDLLYSLHHNACTRGRVCVTVELAEKREREHSSGDSEFVPVLHPHLMLHRTLTFRFGVVMMMVHRTWTSLYDRSDRSDQWLLLL